MARKAPARKIPARNTRCAHVLTCAHVPTCAHLLRCGVFKGCPAGIADNLVKRAAAVTLKERRPLVVVPRETPLNRIHLENLLRLHDAGAVVLPADPAFYQKPQTFEDLGDFIAARVMEQLGIPPFRDLFPRWGIEE